MLVTFVIVMLDHFECEICVDPLFFSLSLSKSSEILEGQNLKDEILVSTVH